MSDAGNEPVTIEVVTTLEEPIGKSPFDAGRRGVAAVSNISSEVLSDSVHRIRSVIEASIHSASQTRSEFELSSFEVTFEVTAKGELRLIGSVSSEFKGGIRMVFQKRSGAIE